MLLDIASLRINIIDERGCLDGLDDNARKEEFASYNNTYDAMPNDATYLALNMAMERSRQCPCGYNGEEE